MTAPRADDPTPMKTPAVLSVIIPAYNEQATVAALLEKVLHSSLDPQRAVKQVVVVDDGSTDDTVTEVQRVIAANPAADIALVRQSNAGKGSAIRKGIARATGDVIIIQDADLEYDPEDYPAIIEPILRGEAKVVYGSRYLRPEQRATVWSRERLGHGGLRYLSFVMGARVLTWAANILFGAGLTDEPTCYKAFRADVLREMKLNCTGFEFCPEVTAKVVRQGIRILEVPIAFHPRTVAEGKKIKWRDGVEGLWTLLRYRFTE